jgi:hypothetical protein
MRGYIAYNMAPMNDSLPARNVRGWTHYETLFEADKVWYTTGEAAKILGMTPQFVRNAFESQALMGQELSASAGASRKMKLIHRDCLLVYLLETANYTPADYLLRLKGLLHKRPKAELEELRVWLEVRLDTRRTRLAATGAAR